MNERSVGLFRRVGISINSISSLLSKNDNFLAAASSENLHVQKGHYANHEDEEVKMSFELDQ